MSNPPKHRPRKRFGQNFLHDRGIIDKLVRAIAPKAGEHLIEIGPGRGALTLPLLEHAVKLQVIELDRDLAANLELIKNQYPALQVHQADVLQFDFNRLCDAAATQPTLRVVGNLPYNISTPVLFHLLRFQNLIIDMHFMLQKEVVDRLAAAPGNKSYGRLSVMLQYLCEVQPLFNVAPECFYPMPKVTSAVVRLTPRHKIDEAVESFDIFRQLVQRCFQQRRKTLRNSLRQWLPRLELSRLDIDTSIRPDTMSVADYVNLANQILSLVEEKPISD